MIYKPKASKINLSKKNKLTAYSRKRSLRYSDKSILLVAISHR